MKENKEVNGQSEFSREQINEMFNKLNKIKDRERRQTAKTRLLVKKAQEAGLTVTEAEIDEYIKKNKK